MRLWRDGILVGSKFSLLLFSLALAVTPFARAQDTSTSTLKTESLRPKLDKAEWSLALGGISSAHGRDTQAAAFFYGSANLDFRFASWMHAYIAPRASMFSSRVQERYDDAGEQSRLWMYDGFLSWDQFKNFEVRAGALNQRFHGTSMLVSGLRSFPGIQEIVRAEIGELKTALRFQQVIPTSHSLNTERARQEELPTFMSATLELEGKHLDLIEWKGTLGSFQWKNIPSKVIEDSRLVGNVGYGEVTADSRFSYAHNGMYGTGEFCLCAKSFVDGVIEYQRIRNVSAPGDSADAQLIGIGPRFHFNDMALDLRYRSYFIESDATVASYAKSRFGNTNRVGYNLEANLEFKKQGFSIFAEAYQAEPINRDPNQRDLSMYYFGVETDYAPF